MNLKNIKRISIPQGNIKRIQSNNKIIWRAWRTEQSTAEAYSKAVPSGAHAVEIDSIGGKSIVRNQHSIVSAAHTSENNGITYESRADGSVYVHGTATAQSTWVMYGDAYSFGGLKRRAHKYLIRSGLSDVIYGDGNGRIGTTPNNGADAIITRTEDDEVSIVTPFMRVASGKTVDGVAYPNLIDLTVMFGSAVAATITTPEDAYALGCPRTYIPYDAGTVVSADVDKVVSAGDDTSAELTIPAAIRALPGYGWSAGTVCNEVDYASKKYIKRVASYTFSGTETVLSNDWYHVDGTFAFILSRTGGISDIAIPANASKTPNVFGTNLQPLSFALIGTGSIGIGVFSNSSYSVIVRQPTSVASNKEELLAWLSGQTVYYELATPIVTDISDLLTDFDPLIDAEGGGTVTFHQSGGTELAVPNKTTARIYL